MKEATLFEVAFLVSTTPPSGTHRERGTGDGGGVVAESSGKFYIERTDNLRIRGEDDALPRMRSLWLQQKYQDP